LARGAPDWGVYSPIIDLSKAFDEVETSVRLGGVVGFDRSGNAIFIDDFSSGLSRWRKIQWAGEKVVCRYGSNIFGGYSVRIQDDGSNDHAPAIYTRLPLYFNQSVGFEVVASWYYLRTRLDLILQFDYATKICTYKARVNNELGLIQVLDSDGSWKTVGTFTSMGSGGMQTFYFKMIVDDSENRYREVRFNGRRFDAKAYHYYEEDSLSPGNILTQIEVGRTTVDYYAGVDLHAAIVTLNE